MSHENNRRSPTPIPTAEPGLGGPGRVVDSADILGGANQVVIRHDGGRLYCLRRTRLGKLILTA